MRKKMCVSEHYCHGKKALEGGQRFGRQKLSIKSLTRIQRLISNSKKSVK
jgi:hypothetical protein